MFDQYDHALSSRLFSSPCFRAAQKRIVPILTPSFLAKPEVASRTVRPTDFLDGMRGYASFTVFITHAVLPLHPNYGVGFWGNDGKNDYWLTQLPIIRLFHSGLVCVHVFFVLSGFSISLKPLKLIRAGTYSTLLDSLVSATFRRLARLYLPVLALLLALLIMVFLGLFDYANMLAMEENWPFLNGALPPPPVLDSYSAQLLHFWKAWWQWSDPMNAVQRITDMPYSGQLWTIPAELKCSFIAWMILLGLAKMPSSLRIITMSSFAVYFYARAHFDPSLFISGAALAELYLNKGEATPKPSEESRDQKIKNWTLFLFALFLCSYPRKGGDKALGWPLIYELGTLLVSKQGKAPLDFFTSIGAVLLVYIVSQSASLQRMFSTPVAKYLGRISFALYCVHQPLLSLFGYRSILFWWSITGNKSLVTYELGFGIALVIQVVITVWVADLFCRAVDEPSVRFARWLEQRCKAT